MEGSRIGRDLLILSRERLLVFGFMFVEFSIFENPDFPTSLIVFPCFLLLPRLSFEIMFVSSRSLLVLLFANRTPRTLCPFLHFAKHDLLLLLPLLNPHLHTRPLIPTFFIKPDIFFTTIQYQFIHAQTLHRQCV